MNFKTIFSVRQNTLAIDLSLLLLRVATGAAFMIHGWGKIQTPFAWMPPEAPVPGILQALAAISEYGGGLALIIGLLTRLGALGLVFTMLGAVLTHLSMHDAFVATPPAHGYEMALIYLAIALTLTTGGPGGLSLDRFLFGRR